MQKTPNLYILPVKKYYSIIKKCRLSFNKHTVSYVNTEIQKNKTKKNRSQFHYWRALRYSEEGFC